MAADEHPPKFRQQAAMAIGVAAKMLPSSVIQRRHHRNSAFQRQHPWTTQLGGISADGHPLASMWVHLDAPGGVTVPTGITLGTPVYPHL